MSYEVLVHTKAQEYYCQQDKKLQKRLKEALKELSKDPHNSRPKADIKKLAGTKRRQDAYRLRVGNYRIVYSIENKKIYVTIIFHRGKEYQEL